MASGKTPKRKNKKNEIIRLSVMAVCAVVFVVCVANLIRIFAEYKQSEDYYNKINSGFDNSPANVANGFSILPMSSYASASPLSSYKNQKTIPVLSMWTIRQRCRWYRAEMRNFSISLQR